MVVWLLNKYVKQSLVMYILTVGKESVLFLIRFFLKQVLLVSVVYQHFSNLSSILISESVTYRSALDI